MPAPNSQCLVPGILSLCPALFPTQSTFPLVTLPPYMLQPRGELAFGSGVQSPTGNVQDSAAKPNLNRGYLGSSVSHVNIHALCCRIINVFNDEVLSQTLLEIFCNIQYSPFLKIPQVLNPEAHGLQRLG